MDAEITGLLDEMESRRVPRAPERLRKENRPNLIAVRSSDANATEDTYWNPPRDGTTDEYTPSNNQNAFYNFSVRLPRPALSVKGLQLMSATIPQANAKFPETALVFWYYRLSKYSGLLPSINNLYCVRLLPSFYKPEMIPNASRYGFNKTFPNYPALASELVKSCRSDVLYDNVMWISTSAWGVDKGYTYKKVPYIPKDISITFNSALNKFQMTGLNTKLAYVDWVGGGAISSIGDVFVHGITWAGDPEANGETYGFNTWKCLRNNRNITPSVGTYLFNIWNDSTSYLQYEVVSYEGAVYQAFVNTEPGDPPTDTAKWVVVPNASASTFWEQIYVEVAQAWESQTYFRAGQFTRFGSPYVVYKALQDGVGKQPNMFEDYWEVYEYVNLPWYEYVPTGPEDENVRALAGKVALEWSPTSLYSKVRQQNIMSACVHKGIEFDAYDTSLNNEPLAGMDWSSGTIYAPGDIMNYDDKGTLYRSLNPFSAVGDWSNSALYSTGQRVLLGGVYYEATESNKNVNPSITMLGNWDYDTAYDAGNWVLYRTGYEEANVSEALGVGGQVSYTTSGAMPFEIGDVVSVSGMSNPIFNLTGTITFVDAISGNFQFPSDVLGNLTGQTGLAIVDPLTSPAIGYRCVQPISAEPELTPDVDPTHWQSYGQYLSGNTIWRRSETNIGHQPGMPGWETWWESVDRSALDTPNWSDAEQYYPGDYVINEDFDKSLYKCIKANVATTPGTLSADYWQLVYVQYAWRQNNATSYKNAESGLYYLSRYYDMYELNDNVFPFGLIFQFPYGVAGQPNVRKSKRLLNTLLGFTWNGLFTKEQFGVVLPTGDLTDMPADNATIVIYNRMRPIPRYLKNVDTGLLGDEPDGTPTSLNMTYTAESFCNLVYSSVVAIYTDIIGPSTIDTTRDTNLLAIADMNSASLGVGFYYPTLECIVENELDGIYGMYIELRDELDEPYFLSNNAVVVLTFKVHY